MTEDTTEAEAPPLRADAARNRRRLLDAAAKAFAEQGLDVSVAEIARRAEVGKGTVFRRFPTKEHLIAAIVEDRLEEVLAAGRELQHADDAGEALREFIRASVHLQVEDRGFLEAVSTLSLANLRTIHAKYLEVAGQLLARAQEQGAIRDDITALDVGMLIGSISMGCVRMHGVVPDVWQRYVDLVFDGLRPEAAHPLSQPPPTPEEMDRAVEAKIRAQRQ